MAISHSFRDTREFANLLAKSARGKMTEKDIARLIYVVEHWFVHGADAATSTSGPGTSVSEGPDIDITYPSVVGRGGDKLITFDYDAAGVLLPVAEYPANSAGMTAALAATAPIIWLYGYTISGNYTIPAGYHVIGNQRDTSILSGLITMSSGSSLTNLSVIRTANDANTLIGVGGSGTGTSYLYGCKVTCTQSGAGAAYAVAANGGLYLNQGDVKVYRCELEATSVGGAAYCGLSSAGRLYVWHSRADVFTTDRWLVA